jgi:predicted AlkP superfamily pyrophosphatase or phosphodiesterase
LEKETTLERDLQVYRPEHSHIFKGGFPDVFIWPRYDGLCVGNIAATTAKLLGVNLPHSLPPLREDVLEGMTDGVNRVIVLVIDAMGWRQLQDVMIADPNLVFHRLAEQGHLCPITTIFPSTTDNALSTIWTGRAPIEHGLLAYEMFLREWGMAVEAIRFSPFFRPFSGDMEDWGFEPEEFLPVPTTAQLLANRGIPSDVVILKEFTHTPLSTMHFRGTRDIYGHVTASDFWLFLRQALINHAGERFALNGYWGKVDSLAHKYGPQDETGTTEIRVLSMLMEEIFLKELPAEAREGTLLLLTADHGQIATPSASSVLLDDHPTLRDALLLPPLGESRAPFFYVRSGQEQVVENYLTQNFSDTFAFFSQEEIIQSGLLGPGDMYAEVPHRLGDIVCPALGDAFWAKDKEKAHKMKGRHGGLLSEEMLVPLLAVRLDRLSD